MNNLVFICSLLKSDVEANNATLKQVMLKAAELLASKYLSKNISYDIHHLDYDNKNNNLENISLMPSRLHNSFHGKAQHLSTKAKKDLLFNNGGYADKCIKIGELIEDISDGYKLTCNYCLKDIAGDLIIKGKVI